MVITDRIHWTLMRVRRVCVEHLRRFSLALVDSRRLSWKQRLLQSRSLTTYCCSDAWLRAFVIHVHEETRSSFCRLSVDIVDRVRDSCVCVCLYMCDSFNACDCVCTVRCVCMFFFPVSVFLRRPYTLLRALSRDTYTLNRTYIYIYIYFIYTYISIYL
jgi:hypothetical protein